MSPAPQEDDRRPRDRRSRPTSPWDAFRVRGRRMRNRRARDHRRPYFVDRFDWPLFVGILTLLFFTLADGVMTLHLLDGDCQEVNPLMGYLLAKGMVPFLLGKYALTVAGLPLLLVFKNYYLFGTGIRVGHLIPIFIFLYALLLGYQAYLWLTIYSG